MIAFACISHLCLQFEFLTSCVVAYMTFHERRFSVPSHQFLRSLLQFYGLKLHHLTPSGILHIAAFVTLYETYMGIEPHFNL
jgi:hypothetical protein